MHDYVTSPATCQSQMRDSRLGPLPTAQHGNHSRCIRSSARCAQLCRPSSVLSATAPRQTKRYVVSFTLVPECWPCSDTSVSHHGMQLFWGSRRQHLSSSGTFRSQMLLRVLPAALTLSRRSASHVAVCLCLACGSEWLPRQIRPLVSNSDVASTCRRRLKLLQLDLGMCLCLCLPLRPASVRCGRLSARRAQLHRQHSLPAAPSHTPWMCLSVLTFCSRLIMGA